MSPFKIRRAGVLEVLQFGGGGCYVLKFPQIQKSAFPPSRIGGWVNSRLRGWAVVGGGGEKLKNQICIE